jgi:hypothetical protein
MNGFGSQIVPGQIGMHKGCGDSAHSAKGAIVDEFHSSHGTTTKKVRPSGFEWDEITDLLIESFLTSRASDPSDTLWTNSHVVHHPQNLEIFAARRTGDNKLIVHGAVFLPTIRARYNSSGKQFLEKWLVFSSDQRSFHLGKGTFGSESQTNTCVKYQMLRAIASHHL